MKNRENWREGYSKHPCTHHLEQQMSDLFLICLIYFLFLLNSYLIQVPAPSPTSVRFPLIT